MKQFAQPSRKKKSAVVSFVPFAIIHRSANLI